MINRTAIILSVGILVCCAVSGFDQTPAPAQKTGWQYREFMISLWGGPTDRAKAKAIAEAHFNTVMCRIDELAFCREFGLKAILFDVTPQMARVLRYDPAVWGYILQDEPETERFPDLAGLAEALRKADPSHPAYINLGWRVCPRTFVDVVRPQVLSYDEYYWWWQGDYFPMLEEYHDLAGREGLPLLCWVEANTGPDSETGKGLIYPPDNIRKLRFSVFTALAYGHKGIQWFVEPLIFTGNQLTRAGQDVAEINAELARLGPVLLGLRSTEVYHFHHRPVPDDTRLLPLHYWVQTATYEILLGMFKDAEGKDYLMAVNMKTDGAQSVALRFSRSLQGVDKFDKKAGAWEPMSVFDASTLDKRPEWEDLFPLRLQGRQAVEFTLPPGDGQLFRIR
jgi:hypothetical protein